MVAGGKDEGRDREFGMDMYILLYLKWITNKDLLYSTWISVQHYEAAWMKGEFGVHVFVWLSPLPFTRNYHNIAC